MYSYDKIMKILQFDCHVNSSLLYSTQQPNKFTEMRVNFFSIIKVSWYGTMPEMAWYNKI